MAVTTQKSDIITNIDASTFNDSVDDGGTLHTIRFLHDQSGAGDATSSVALVKLPPGRVRLYLNLSLMYVNWTTSSATLDLGWDAYTDLAGDAVVADPNGLIDGLDVDTVGVFSGEDLVTSLTNAAGGTYLFESQTGVTIRATSQDQALVASDDIVGHFVYAKD